MELFIFLKQLWPSGRFLREFFFKNYLGWKGKRKTLKKSSGAQSEDLGPSVTIQKFFQKNIPGFICSVCVPFLGRSPVTTKAFASVGPVRMLEGTE